MNRSGRQTHDQHASTESRTAPTEADRAVYEHFVDVSNDWAARYCGLSRGMSNLDLQLRRENTQLLLSRILAGRNDGMLHVLDIGCGTGNALDGFPRDRISVTGLDPVPEMIRVAALRHPEDDYLVGQIEQLPFRDGSADVVLCLGVLEYLADPLVGLTEIHRVLRGDGHLIVSFPNRKSLFRSVLEMLTAMERLARVVLGMFSPGWSRGKEGRQHRHREWSKGVATSTLLEAGFLPTTIFFNTFGIWGRLGRNRASLAVSRRLTNLLRESGALGSLLASTMVILGKRAFFESGK